MAKDSNASRDPVTGSLPDMTTDDITIPKNAQDMIGRQLQVYYSGLVEQRIPDAFSSLLDQLSGTGRRLPATDPGSET